MKIWTKSVWHWRPDGTPELIPEECESFDYEGPIALCKDSPDPPPPPDYTGAATATANSQKYNQNTPLGSMTWSLDPSNPSSWTSNISLNPNVQASLDSQLHSSAGVGKLQSGQVDAVANRAPFSLGSVQDISDKAYSAQTARLDPQWQHASEMNDAQLANQGITRGSEAYDNAMRTFNQGKNDAYSQARLSADATMPQTFALAQGAYEQPLNELNALRSASQVSMPQFGGPLAPAPYGQAAAAQGQYGQGLYNAQVGTQNANTQGMYGLGSAALMYAALA